jgi:hypothetical protein
MLFAVYKYTCRFTKHVLLSIVFIVAFALCVNAQTGIVNSSSNKNTLNPLLRSSFNKSIKANPLLAGYIKPSTYELMYWPAYPLTAAQIEARNSLWERRNHQTIGEQIAGDVIKNYVNSLIYGRKMPVAVAPKF